MKVTFILKNVTDVFFDGNGSSIVGLMNMTDPAKFAHLNNIRRDMGFTMKIGAGQFRDQVELNQILRNPQSFTFKIEPRKGYKLASFDIA